MIKKVWVLIKKEILDILRDRKTLVIMVLVPVLLYPLLIIGMTLVIGMLMQDEAETVLVIGYNETQEKLGRELERLYGEREDEFWATVEFWALEADRESKGRAEGYGTDQDDELSTGTDGADPDAEAVSAVTVQEDAAAFITDWAGWCDVYLISETLQDGRERILIVYTSADSDSLDAKEAVEELLEAYRQELVLEKLDLAGLDESFLEPILYEAQDEATAAESFGIDFGSSMGGCIALMLIVTIMLGAVYPSIDVTAGEKERGTLETLLTLPVTNFQMILSKYISVALLATVTAILSVLSLGASVVFMIFGLTDSAEIEGVSLAGLLSAIPILLLVVFVMALLASALCMCFCVFAKSFKEANNYVTPILLVVMFASMAGMIPSVEFNYRTAMIPVFNVSLLVREIVMQQLDPSLAFLVIGINLCYSVLIAWILAKIYNSEDILFGEGFRHFRLFARRSEIRKGTVPDIGDVVVCLVVVLLLVLYAGTAAAVHFGIWGTAVNELIMLAVPLAVVWHMKSDVKRLFSLNTPRLGRIPGSVLLYVGAFCLMLAASSVLLGLFPESSENLTETFSVFTEEPFQIQLFVIALLPAACEELLFRGFLFGSLREQIQIRRRRRMRQEQQLQTDRPGGMAPRTQADRPERITLRMQADQPENMISRMYADHQEGIVPRMRADRPEGMTPRMQADCPDDMTARMRADRPDDMTPRMPDAGTNLRRNGLVPAIVISAFVFGAFHMSLVKLLPTAMLGAAFAYIVSGTDSIYVSMLLHFINNAFSLAVMKYPEETGRLLPILMKEELSVMDFVLLIVIGAVFFAAGLWLMRRGEGKLHVRH